MKKSAKEKKSLAGNSASRGGWRFRLLLASFVAASSLALASSCANNAKGQSDANSDRLINEYRSVPGDPSPAPNPYAHGEHDWVCDYLGVIDGNNCHKTYCSICGLVVAKEQWCTNSYNCTDCGHTTNTSSYKRDFIPIDGNKQNKPKIVIVAAKGFETSGIVTKYVDFRKAQGYSCEVKYYAKGTSGETIRTALKEEYVKNQNMVVLIMGRGGSNSEYGIPEFVGKNKPNIQGKDRVPATDFWYGFYEDRDYDLFPQAVVGRLSARTPQELEAQIDKIIKVEKGQSPATKNIVLVQQKRLDGSMPFADEPKDIEAYIGSKFNGVYSVKWEYTDNYTSINSTINQGVMLVSYSGHGGTDFWGDSRYNVNNVASLKNGSYPIVFGVTCNSANYTYGDVCVAEAFMRNSQGGAVGYIGASNVMISDYSKMATVGHGDIPGMIGSLLVSGYDSKYKVDTLGGLYLAALRAIKMSNISYSDQFKGYSIEVLNLFGDPTLSLEYITK